MYEATTIFGTFSKRTIWIVTIVIVSIIISAITAISAVIATKNPNKRDDLSTSRVIQKYADYLATQHGIVVDVNDLSNENSTRYKALLWLVDDELVESPDSPFMLERYILAVLYYSTGYFGWNNSTGWLSNQPICSWYGVTCSGDPMGWELWDNTTDFIEMFNGNYISGYSPKDKVFSIELRKSIYMRDICDAKWTCN